MSEATRKKIIFCLFAVTIVWAYFHFSGQQQSKKVPPPSSPAISATMPAPANISSTAKTTDDLYLYARYKGTSWGKNPFYHNHRIAKKQVVRKQAKLRLLGILYREVNAQALINGRVVAVGDTLHGYQVFEISRDYVTLRNADNSIRLHVKKESS